ncbi:hypothetical protein [Achromobacter xylosoxidans]|uniref:hypothetical protein n=1 Tax=Alcaligenes xylosoxydans xylosoxydans TaxID=85698 RepID=UPI001F12FCCD|nr:hypothetical protein [Achromobacter xylosoxidans]
MSRDDLTAKQMDEADELAQADTDRAVREWIRKNPKELVLALVRVNEQLATVARKTAELAEQNLATPYNPQFIYHLVQQSDLINQTNQLIEAIKKADSPAAS